MSAQCRPNLVPILLLGVLVVCQISLDKQYAAFSFSSVVTLNLSLNSFHNAGCQNDLWDYSF